MVVYRILVVLARLGRVREEELERRVLEYVESIAGPLSILDVATVARGCRLNRQTAKSILLELALDRRVVAQRLSGRWLFSVAHDI